MGDRLVRVANNDDQEGQQDQRPATGAPALERRSIQSVPVREELPRMPRRDG